MRILFLGAQHGSMITESEIAILSKYPGYTKFLNMMIKEHYAEYL
jgi:hypothetical protein